MNTNTMKCYEPHSPNEDTEARTVRTDARLVETTVRVFGKDAPVEGLL